MNARHEPQRFKPVKQTMRSDWEITLKRFGQGHLLDHISPLDSESWESFQSQLEGIDFPLIQELFEKHGSSDEWGELASQAQPPAAIRLQDNSEAFPAPDEARARGQHAIADGKVGMIMVAGGQGSRLGFAHPKGLFPLGPVSGRTLLQIHIDKLMAINERSGATVPLYVMTSPATHAETEDFLKQNHWFGYPQDHSRIFCQGTMPAVDAATGKLLLADDSQLFLSPDGHGGMLKALAESDCLNDMMLRGLEQVFYCQIDNPLAQICDTLTIGHHILAGSEMSCQAVPKRDPLQKVGNIVSVNGQTLIIEYSDLPEDVARKTNADGSLMLWAGSIAVHVMNVDFLQRMTRHADALPFHLAHKKVPFIDETGTLVKPEQPNAIKFERFIFDLLPLADHAIVVEVDPADAFSPVKNGPTEATNTAVTAQQAMVEQAKRCLLQLGVEVAEQTAVEIHPRLMLDYERLSATLAGQSTITSPIYLK